MWLKLKRWLPMLLPVGVALLASGVYAWTTPYSYVDDAYIFMRYARNLLNGDGIAFNPGEPSLGITSPFWTFVLTGACALFRGDVEWIAKAVDMGFYALGALVLGQVFWKSTGQQWMALWMATSCVAYPSVSKLAGTGMEVGIHFALFAVLMLALSRSQFSWGALGVIVGLLILTRPEGAILIPAIAISLLPEYKDRPVVYLKGLARFAGVVLLVCLLWMGYAFLLTGALLPPTARGRLALWLPMLYGITYQQYTDLNLLGRLGIGIKGLLRYLLDPRYAYLSLFLTLVLLNFSSSTHRKLRRMILFVLLYGISLIVVYVVFYPVFYIRYFVNLSAVSFFSMAVWTGQGIQWLQSRVSSRTALRWLCLSVALLTVVVYAGLHTVSYRRFQVGLPQQAARIEAGRWIATHTPQYVTVALEPIGAVGYYAQRYVIDLGALIHPEDQAMMPNGCTESQALDRVLRATQPDFVADCSGICPALPVLNAYDHQFREVAHFGPRHPSEQVVGCTIYEMKW